MCGGEARRRPLPRPPLPLLRAPDAHPRLLSAAGELQEPHAQLHGQPVRRQQGLHGQVG